MELLSNQEMAHIFKVLGDETRLQIVQLLQHNELCGCHLLAHFAITQPTLSYHMKQLVAIDLVQTEKKGKWVHYNLNGEQYEKVKQFFHEKIDIQVKGCE